MPVDEAKKERKEEREKERTLFVESVCSKNEMFPVCRVMCVKVRVLKMKGGGRRTDRVQLVKRHSERVIE